MEEMDLRADGQSFKIIFLFFILFEGITYDFTIWTLGFFGGLAKDMITSN